MKSGLALSLVVMPVALAACEGPTLEVGQRIEATGDAGDELDAGAFDASDGAPRVRDASFGDRDLHLDERHACFVDFDCLTNIYRERCSPTRGYCVECVVDRDCPDNQRCVGPELYCRVDDRPRDDTAATSGASPTP